MPQMGESIFEGTITKWLKKVGDKVQRDEPLFEISTDKVDAEIPAPAAGVLREIKVKEGATVQVNSVVAVIGGAGSAAQSAPAQAAPAKQRRHSPRNRKPRRSNNSRNRPQGRKLCPSKLLLRAATALRVRMCARHRWCAAWRAKTMSILIRFPAPAWVDASARTIFRALSSSMAGAEPDRKL